ncbi:MAG: hypothetical protein IPK63_20405 [Candidatus Competibacteraceae bacterium]|nr:hypothetical protein [Candidatus Competibacteraceae bacterium]
MRISPWNAFEDRLLWKAALKRERHHPAHAEPAGDHAEARRPISLAR